MVKYDRCKLNGVIDFDVLVDEILLDLIPNKYQYVSSVLYKPLPYKKWDLKLTPPTHDIVIVFTQDYIHTDNNIFPELEQIEEYYKEVDTVILIHWNHALDKIYKGPLKLVEFPTHSFQFVQELILAQDQWEINKTNTVSYMCLNGIPKVHRSNVYEFLSLDNVNNNILSFAGKSNIEMPSYENYDWNNVTNFISLQEVYNSSPVNIITESLYTEPSGIISEKSLMAFLSLQLPIFIAHQNIIRDVKSYGFDTFDDILDNSYDTLPNNIRWKEAIKRNKHILSGKYNYKELFPRLRENQNHLLNNYLNLLEERLINQLTAILSKN